MRVWFKGSGHCGLKGGTGLRVRGLKGFTILRCFRSLDDDVLKFGNDSQGFTVMRDFYRDTGFERFMGEEGEVSMSLMGR